jgi:hypothetical protein
MFLGSLIRTAAISGRNEAITVVDGAGAPWHANMDHGDQAVQA